MTEDEDIENEVSKISGPKLPPFWTSSPITWFIQAEAQFALCRVISDMKKYYYVLASLPQEVIESILDYVQNPPDSAVYRGLKALLIERHSLSENNRIERILSSEELGDRKPSDFYRSLIQLAGTSETFNTDLIKKLWLRRLPHVVNVALIPHEDSDIKEMSAMADKIWEASRLSQPYQVSSIGPSASTSSSISELKHEIEELKKLVRNISFNQDRNRSQSRGRARSIQRAESSQGAKLCWYHLKFKENAQKCISPCSYARNLNSSEPDKKNY